MYRNFEFYHGDQCMQCALFQSVSDPNIIDIDTCRMAFHQLLLFRKNRENMAFLLNVTQNDIIKDLDSDTTYVVSRKKHAFLMWPPLTYQYIFYLIPSVQFQPTSVTYNITNFGEFNFIHSMQNIENTINQLSVEDQKLAEELINLIITTQHLEKSNLEKFKDMLISNTDVLGLFAQVLLAIILK